MNLAAHVSNCLERHGLTQTIGVIAVSGGPDSVVLAHVCASLLQEGKIDGLVLAHVNHQLRGAESDADELFVKSLPTGWQTAHITCRTTRIDMASMATAEHENLEAVARRERYRWLTQVAQEEKAAWIATGHTADDQAETVLFRLLRGSGVLGLGGMSECRTFDNGPKLLRPLVTVHRKTLLDYLHEQQIDYRIDSSNRDLRFTRNRLRLELMPLLERDYNPAIVGALCRLAEQARELHAAIAAEAAELLRLAELPRAGDMLVFSTEQFKNASTNRLCEMFRLVWQREAWPMGDMDFERWNRLADIAAGKSTACDFPGQIYARRLGNVVQIQRRSSRV
jgi:tRNA(Ile)-lysidine synthase